MSVIVFTGVFMPLNPGGCTLLPQHTHPGHPPPNGQQAGGTYPTGTLSCSEFHYPIPKSLMSTLRTLHIKKNSNNKIILTWQLCE